MILGMCYVQVSGPKSGMASTAWAEWASRVETDDGDVVFERRTGTVRDRSGVKTGTTYLPDLGTT